MRVIPPLTVTNAMLTSSTCAEPHATEQTFAMGTTYALGDKAILGAPSSTVTITVAAPAVVTWSAHGQAAGTPVVFSTTGALPTGLVAGTVYYVRYPTANAFNVAATPSGVPIITTGTQSGTHTATTFVHRVYESLQAGNIGRYPALASSATWWLDVGPTNRWAMFDLLRNTATEQASPLTVVLTPGVRLNSLALLGLEADAVSVEITSGGPVVYSYSTNLSTREVFDWYDYFFQPFSTQPSLVLFDLPPYTNAIITVTITRSAGDVRCGALCLGSFAYIGETLYRAESDGLNFSTVSRNAFGDSVLLPRRTVPKTVQTVRSLKTRTNALIDLRVALNAVPAVWSGLDDSAQSYFESMLILGYYRRFSINIEHPDYALTTLELEEI